MTQPSETQATILWSPTRTEIVKALIKAKSEFGKVVKDKNNPAFRTKYADLGAVLDAVEPALLANGLLLVQPTLVADGQILHTEIVHTSGEWMASEWKLNPVKQDPQGEGSALTYGRRYQALTLLGLAPEDDDGAAASNGNNNGQRSRSRSNGNASNGGQQEQRQSSGRNWAQEARNLQTEAEVVQLGSECNAFGEFVGEVKRVLTERRTELHQAEANRLRSA